LVAVLIITELRLVTEKLWQNRLVGIMLGDGQAHRRCT